MKRYLLKRILLSLLSLFIVVGTVMILCYSAIDRTNIFTSDLTYVKYQDNEKKIYEYTKYQKYGYLEYTNFTTYVGTKYRNQYGDDYVNKAEYITAIESIQDAGKYVYNTDVKEFSTYYAKAGYEIKYLAPLKRSRGYLLAVREKNVFERLWDYATHFITFETINDVTDEALTDRYIRFEWDERSHMPALVGSGTRHKYLIYFDDRFPFIHQNLVHLNLGTSYVVFRDTEMTDVMNNPTGDVYFEEQEYPSQVGTGITNTTSYDFHTVTYNYGELSDIEKAMYTDKYTLADQKHSGLSRLALSFTLGIIATVIAYIIGLPLGILMARKKDKLVDKLLNLYIIFIMAVPSLAYIFMFATVGTTLFNLPYKYANATVKVVGCILPIVSLALPAIGSLMKWMRRYMIDQQNSDYVKFARSQGLSESEIFSKHIAKNAFVFLVHSIPAEILGALVGAIVTERVYGVPGVGNLLTDAISSYDNGAIVACTLFYTFISILAVILGDLLLTKYDPRISFAEGN